MAGNWVLYAIFQKFGIKLPFSRDMESLVDEKKIKVEPQAQLVDLKPILKQVSYKYCKLLTELTFIFQKENLLILLVWVNPVQK